MTLLNPTSPSLPAVVMLRRRAQSHRHPATQQAVPLGESALELNALSGGRTVVVTEKGQSYTLTDPRTGQILSVKKVERIGHSLHLALTEDHSLELQDFFVSALPRQGDGLEAGTPVQAQAQFVFYMGTSVCSYGIVDALVPPVHWGPHEEARTLWQAAETDFCPAWASGTWGGLASLPPVDPGLVPHLGDGLLALAALLSALKGSDSPASVAVPADLIISGNASLGPVLSTNDLRVTAYDASGQTLGSPVSVDANGHYSLTVRGGHTGAVTLRLTSSGNGLDYVSEAPVVATDFPQDFRGNEDLGSGVLQATSVASGGGTLTLHITPITDIASHLLVADTATGAPALKAGLSSADVGAVNRGVAEDYLGVAAQGASGAFQDITTVDVGQTTILSDGSASLAPSLYGLELLNLAQLAASQGGLDRAQAALMAQTSFDSAHQTVSSVRLVLNGGAVHPPINYDQNSTAPVTTVQLAGTTGFSNISYTITGGADAQRFDVNHDTGEITFVTPPQVQIPLDSDHNNTYQLIVTVQAAYNDTPITASQLLWVTPVLGG